MYIPLAVETKKQQQRQMCGLAYYKIAINEVVQTELCKHLHYTSATARFTKHVEYQN